MCLDVRGPGALRLVTLCRVRGILEVLARAEVMALEGELECPEDVRMHSCGVDLTQIS